LVHDGIHADQIQPELPNSIQEAVKLRLVDDHAGDLGLAGAALHRHPVEGWREAAAQLAGDHDLVARWCHGVLLVVASPALLDQDRRAMDETSSSIHPIH
jgi:hypothetical protein